MTTSKLLASIIKRLDIRKRADDEEALARLREALKLCGLDPRKESYEVTVRRGAEDIHAPHCGVLTSGGGGPGRVGLAGEVRRQRVEDPRLRRAAQRTPGPRTTYEQVSGGAGPHGCWDAGDRRR